MLEMMEVRALQLQCTTAGLKKFNIPLVCYDSITGTITPGGDSNILGADDLGIYYFIPKLTQLAGLSLDTAVYLFYQLVCWGTFLIGLSGCFFFLKSWLTRLLAVAVSYWFYQKHILLCHDVVYCLAPGMAFVLIPWALYFTREKHTLTSKLLFFLSAGFLVSISEFIRNFSAIPSLFFVCYLLLIADQFTLKNKLIIFTALLIGFFSIFLLVKHILSVRDAFLLGKNSAYHKFINQHPLWHPIYLGFGYVPNPYGIKWNDEIAKAKAKSIAPDAKYMSEEYDAIIGREVLRIIIETPLFALKAFALKFIDVLKNCYIFLLLAFSATLFKSRSWSYDAGFLVTWLLIALPGILANPSIVYIFGAVMVAILYMLANIDYLIETFMEHFKKQNLKILLKKINKN